MTQSRQRPHLWPTCPQKGHLSHFPTQLDSPGGSDGNESTCNARDPGSIPGSGISPGGGHGNPLQYSGLENPMDRGAWWATVHGVSESDMTEKLTLHPIVLQHPSPPRAGRGRGSNQQSCFVNFQSISLPPHPLTRWRAPHGPGHSAGHTAGAQESASLPGEGFSPCCDPRIPDPANPRVYPDQSGEHRPAPKTSSMASTSPSRETAQPQTLAR